MSKQRHVDDATEVPRIAHIEPTTDPARPVAGAEDVPSPATSGYGLAMFELLRHRRCDHGLTAPVRYSA